MKISRKSEDSPFSSPRLPSHLSVDFPSVSSVSRPLHACRLSEFSSLLLLSTESWRFFSLFLLYLICSISSISPSSKRKGDKITFQGSFDCVSRCVGTSPISVGCMYVSIDDGRVSVCCMQSRHRASKLFSVSTQALQSTFFFFFSSLHLWERGRIMKGFFLLDAELSLPKTGAVCI